MARKGRSAEEIIAALREAEVRIGQGNGGAAIGRLESPRTVGTQLIARPLLRDHTPGVRPARICRRLINSIWAHATLGRSGLTRCARP